MFGLLVYIIVTTTTLFVILVGNIHGLLFVFVVFYHNMYCIDK